jgi:NAD(P)-dependent dehydrogenase (short-subunit alcohol dehydrogenase family)
LDVPASEIRSVMETNFVAPARMLQAAANRMTAGGAIINVTSRLATCGVRSMGIHGSSKGALLVLSPRGCRVR